MSPLTFCYHAVSRSWKHPLAVREESLQAHLAWVARRGYGWGSLADIARQKRVAHVTFDDAYASVLRAVPHLRAAGACSSVFVPTASVGGTFGIGQLGEASVLERTVLTWDELREIAESGMLIGSHSVTHRPLQALDDSELRSELAESREQIEDEIGRPCVALSYPFGEFDDRVRVAARQAGYVYCFGLSDGSGSLSDLPRMLVFRDDVGPRFALKMSAAGRRASGARRHRRRLAAT